MDAGEVIMWTCIVCLGFRMCFVVVLFCLMDGLTWLQPAALTWAQIATFS